LGGNHGRDAISGVGLAFDVLKDHRDKNDGEDQCH
jgi:hypothetical protein